MRRQRWEALYDALQSCPRFDADPLQLMSAATDLTQWSETKVKPWIGSERVADLRQKREVVEKWVIKTAHQSSNNPEDVFNIPYDAINELRRHAAEQVSEALKRMRKDYSPLVKEQKF